MSERGAAVDSPAPAAGFLLVTNAAAGSSDQDAVSEAAEVLRQHGSVEVVTSGGPDDLLGAVRRLDGRRLVVAGGDGSLHALAGAVHGDAGLAGLSSLGPVGVLPLGTGNDLARTLGLPLQGAEAAALRAATGTPVALDVLVDDAGGVVVNAVHAGVGAEAAERAERLKPALGPAAYPVGALAAGATSAGWRLEVTVDGTAVADGDERLLMVGVTVGRTIGGGAPLAPDADASDGLADVVLVAATGPLARGGYALALREGEHTEREDVRVLRGRTVAVAAPGEGDDFHLNADGETSGPHRRRTWTVQPGAWSVVC